MAGCGGRPAEFDRSWVNRSPLRLEAVPVGTGHQPPEDLTYIIAGFSCRQTKEKKSDDYLNPLMMTKY